MAEPELSEVDLRDQLLRDWQLAADDFGLDVPPTREGEWFVEATAVAQSLAIGLERIGLAKANASIYTCDATRVQEFADARQLVELPEQPSSGRIVPKISGTATIAQNTEFTYQGTKRYRITRSYVNVQQGVECEASSVLNGEDTEIPGGAEVVFTAPPINVASTATVSISAPIEGGRGIEDIESKRQRVIADMGSPAAGANPAHVREIVLAADPSITECYVYSAIGGPGSSLVVPVVNFNIEGRSITRRPTTAQLLALASALQVQLPHAEDQFVWAPNELLTNFTITTTLPGVAAGNGWLDAAPWPPLVGGDGGRVSITAVGSNGYTITVNAGTSTAPVDSQTHIAWWSSVDRVFRTSVILSKTGGAGAWALTLQTPYVDYAGNLPVVGDYVCPAAKNTAEYGKSWLKLFDLLGPGQATTDVNRLYPIGRANRYPEVSDTKPSNLSDLLLYGIETDPTTGEVKRLHPEMTGARLQYAPVTTPTVPPTVATAPYILVPRHFGIYKA